MEYFYHLSQLDNLDEVLGAILPAVLPLEVVEKVE